MHEETKAHLTILRGRLDKTPSYLKEPSGGVRGNYDPILDKLLIALAANYDQFAAKLATDELYDLQAALWIEGLKGLSRSQIEHGMKNFKGQFRPTPDTFRLWCGEQAETHRGAAYSAFDRSKAIEQRGDPVAAKERLSEIKDMLSK